MVNILYVFSPIKSGTQMLVGDFGIFHMPQVHLFEIWPICHQSMTFFNMSDTPGIVTTRIDSGADVGARCPNGGDI